MVFSGGREGFLSYALFGFSCVLFWRKGVLSYARFVVSEGRGGGLTMLFLSLREGVLSCAHFVFSEGKEV